MIEQVISADGTRLAVVTEGDGREIVFVHGAGGDRHAHPELKAALGGRITSYDRRGRGDSSETLPYALAREVEDLRAVIASRPVPPVVFGTSLGGRIALELLRDPPALEALILFEAPATDRPDPAYVEQLDRVGACLEEDPEAALVLHCQLILNRSEAEIAALRSDTADWALRIRNMAITHREISAVHQNALFEAEAYRSPPYPVHLLSGTATLPFIKHATELIAALPFVMLHRLNGQTHSAPREAPLTVAKVVTEILS